MIKKWQKIFGLGVLALVVGEWLWMSWLRWPDPIRDFGRELYLPWQVNQGRLLYHDLFHLYGPLSVYFNALVFRCLGTSLTSLLEVNFFLIILLSFLIFSLFRFLGGFWTAMSALLVFLGIFAFGQYMEVGNYNYVSPYAHEVVHGLILSLLAFFVLKQWLLRPSVLYLILLGFIWVLVFLTKFELFLALSLALIAVFILQGLMSKDIGRSLMRLGIIVAVSVLLFHLFPSTLTGGNILETILNRYVRLIFSPAIKGYYGDISGFDTPVANIWLVGISAAEYLMAAVSLFLLSNFISKIKEKLARRIILGALVLIIIASGFFLTSHVLWLLFRALPVALLLMIAVVLVELFQKPLNKQDIDRHLLFFAMAVFSFALLFKIILNVHVYHYGFALAMPGALLLTTAFVYYLPLLGRGRWFSPRIFRALVFAMLLAIVIGHLKWAEYYYNRKDHAIGQGKDRMLAYNPHVYSTPTILNYAVEWIQRNTKPTDTVVVVPEGAMINFLSRRVNPTKDIEFMPSNNDQKVIESFQKKIPDYIVVLYRDMSEYGAAFFGRDYGVKVDRWIKDNYSIIFYMQAPTKAGPEFVTIYMHGKVSPSSYKGDEIFLH